MKEAEVIFLAEYLAKVALVLGIAFLILYPLRRQVAAVKHRVWTGLFLAVIALPAVMALPRWDWIPSLESSDAIAVPSAQIAEVESGAEVRNSSSVAALPVVVPTQPDSFRWGSLFVAAWLFGALVVVTRMAVARFLLSRLKRQMQPVSPRVRAVADGLLDTLDIQREVSITLSDQVATPFGWGIGRPSVVLPRAVENWNDSELGMVLRHELSHVKRWDAASLLVSRVFFALNWINPLAWIASRQAMRLREEACDQMVLAGGHRESEYAALLLSQAKLSNRSLFRSATISMAEMATIERRIRNILSVSRAAKSVKSGSRGNTAGWALSAVIAVTLFVGLAGISQAQKTQPTQVAETAEIQAKLDAIIIPKLELKDTPLGDAIAFLQRRSAELDTERDPIARGVNFVLKGYDEVAAIPTITLNLSNVSLGEAVRYITDLAQREYLVEANAIIIREYGEGGASLAIRSEALAADRKYSDEENAKIAATKHKLESLVMPSIEFSDTPLKSALDFIVLRSKSLSKAGGESEGAGINCILVGAPQDLESIRISLKMYNAPLSEILRYTAELAGMAYEVQPAAVVFSNRAKIVAKAELTKKGDTAEIEKKLNGITIPSLEFSRTPLTHALDFIESKSIELDARTTDPAHKGVNVVLSGKGDAVSETLISLELYNVRLLDAFRYTAEVAGLELRIEPHAVILSPAAEAEEEGK